VSHRQHLGRPDGEDGDWSEGHSLRDSAERLGTIGAAIPHPSLLAAHRRPGVVFRASPLPNSLGWPREATRTARAPYWNKRSGPREGHA